MTINEQQDEIIEEFSQFDDWMDRYQLLIDMGEEQAPLDEADKIDANLIDGCQSRVWIVQFGGQTPLNIARALSDEGVKILGTSIDSIDIAEDRDLFRKMMDQLEIPMPESGMATNIDEALACVKQIGGYPVMIRPSFVLGGRGMEVIYDENITKTLAPGSAFQTTVVRPPASLDLEGRRILPVAVSYHAFAGCGTFSIFFTLFQIKKSRA